MNRSPQVFVCSSRRHLYIASGLALASDRESHLLLIDQAAGEPDEVVRRLQLDGVFAGVHIRLKARGRSGQRAELAYLRQLATSLSPETVYAGNDRKYQFQYLVRASRRLKTACQGVYMDDGTGTYESGIHLNRWRGFLDRTIIALAKRLSIGWWYQRTRYFGDTQWVDECWVQHPHLLPAPVQERRRIRQLDSQVFRKAEHRAVLERAFLNNDESLVGLDRLSALIVLPLSKHLPKGPARERFFDQLRSYCHGQARIGIKYHPREKDQCFALAENEQLIPQSIPAEILFSHCQLQVIVGDTSSALLSAQWLQTDARIVSVCPEDDQQAPLSRLLSRAGVEIQIYQV